MEELEAQLLEEPSASYLGLYHEYEALGSSERSNDVGPDCPKLV